MKTPRIATVYQETQYWSDIERNWRTDRTYDGGSCLPAWVHDFISIHHCYWDDTDMGWSLVSPLKFVEHPSCRRPHWEELRFETHQDAIIAAKWLARLGSVWVVDCDENAKAHKAA